VIDPTKLRGLTERVHHASYPVPSCWECSLVLRDLIKSQMGRNDAYVRTCSVTWDGGHCDNHCVVFVPPTETADGFICDATCWQFGAIQSEKGWQRGTSHPDFLVVPLLEGNPDVLGIAGALVYTECVDEEYKGREEEWRETHAAEALAHGTFTDNDFERLGLA
jgi:hypothetical protein